VKTTNLSLILSRLAASTQIQYKHEHWDIARAAPLTNEAKVSSVDDGFGIRLGGESIQMRNIPANICNA
jgi:hypothetical protein